MIFDSKFEVVSVVELEHHEKKFEVPAEFSISNVILSFVCSCRKSKQLRSVRNHIYAFRGDVLVAPVLILNVDFDLNFLYFFILFFEFFLLEAFYSQILLFPFVREKQLLLKLIF